MKALGSTPWACCRPNVVIVRKRKLRASEPLSTGSASRIGVVCARVRGPDALPETSKDGMVSPTCDSRSSTDIIESTDIPVFTGDLLGSAREPCESRALRARESRLEGGTSAGVSAEASLARLAASTASIVRGCATVGAPLSVPSAQYGCTRSKS